MLLAALKKYSLITGEFNDSDIKIKSNLITKNHQYLNDNDGKNRVPKRGRNIWNLYILYYYICRWIQRKKIVIGL